MKVVAVSMVRNEADVIEAFVRHTAAFVDFHLVFDHLSTDGTGFLLRKLRREGLPLAFYHCTRPEFLQDHHTRQLLGVALRDHAADWVLPLDGDEFLQADGGPAGLRARLAARLPAGEPVRLWMHDYLATAEDDPAEPNPVKRVTYRAKPHVTKAILPRAFAARPGAGWANGNHQARLGERVHESAVLPDVWLAHLVCRTPAQTVVKVVRNELRRLAEGASTLIGDNYGGHFRKLATFPGPMLADPRSYHEPDERAPAAYHGGPLRYAPFLTPAESAVVAVLSFAGRIAADHGRLVDAVRALTPPPGRLARFKWWLRRLVRGAGGDALPAGVDRLAPPLRDGLVLPDSRTGPDGLACAIELTELTRAASGAGIDFTVTVRNVGLSTWLAKTADGIGTVRLGVQAVGPDGLVADANLHRADLPADVDPGDAVTIRATCPAPAGALGFDLVAEGVRWFGYRGCRAEVPAATPRAA